MLDRIIKALDSDPALARPADLDKAMRRKTPVCLSNAQLYQTMRKLFGCEEKDLGSVYRGKMGGFVRTKSVVGEEKQNVGVSRSGNGWL